VRTAATATPAAPAQPAQVFDAGTHFVISGPSRSSVEDALKSLSKDGYVALTAPAQVGAKWIASCSDPKRSRATVEEMGLQRIITGPTRECVEDKVRELRQFGAVLINDIQCTEGTWMAVCDTARG
jgi:hypothetical protein